MADVFFSGLKNLRSELSHELIPEFDLRNTCLSKYFNTNDVDHQLFLPAHNIPKAVQEGEDPVRSLVIKKTAWKEHYKELLRKSTKQNATAPLKQMQKDLLTKDINSIHVPQWQIKYLMLARQDPDQFFSGEHNWYYTRGCLSYLAVDDTHVLISTQGKASDQLCVTRLKEEPYWHPDEDSADNVTPSKGHAIFQVLGIRSGDKGFIGVRQRNKCSVYSLDDNNVVSLTKNQESFSNVPFTGLDMSQVQYCTISSHRTLKLWDLATSRCIKMGSCVHEDAVELYWSDVQYGKDSNSLLVTDCCCITWWDTRTELQHNQSLILKAFKDIEACEDLSLVFPSKLSEHLLYIASTHSVLLVDERFLGTTPIHRWTHMMSSPPLYGCAVSVSEDQEVLCVANQVVQLAMSSRNATSLLVQLPTVRDSLNRAQASGQCLNLQLEHRAVQSITGLACLPRTRNSGFDILTQTAAGDVFCQQLRKHANCHKRDLEGITKVPTLSKKLRASRRCNMRIMYKGLRNESLKLSEDVWQCKSQAWQQSKHDLESSTDILSPVLLSAWEIEDSPEWRNQDPSTMKFDTTAATQKVNTWLDTLAHSTVPEPLLEQTIDMFLSQELHEEREEDNLT